MFDIIGSSHHPALSSKYLCDSAAPWGTEYCWNIQTLERCDTQFVKKLSTRFHLKPNSIKKSNKIRNTPGNLGKQNFSDTNFFSKCTFLRIMIICGKLFFDCQTDLLKLKTCNLEKTMWARVSKDSNLKGRSNNFSLKMLNNLNRSDNNRESRELATGSSQGCSCNATPRTHCTLMWRNIRPRSEKQIRLS